MMWGGGLEGEVQGVGVGGLATNTQTLKSKFMEDKTPIVIFFLRSHNKSIGRILWVGRRLAN